MKSKTKVILATVALVLAGFGGPILVSAAGTGGLTVCDTQVTVDPKSNTGTVAPGSCQLQDLFSLIAKLTNFLIGVAALYAVARIVISGAQMVFSGGSQKMVESGRRGLNGSIIGFVIVMVAFLIINTIFMLLDLSLGLPFSFGNPIQLLPFK